MQPWVWLEFPSYGWCRSGACFVKSAAPSVQPTPAAGSAISTAVASRAFISVTAGSGGPAASQQPAQLQVLRCYSVVYFNRFQGVHAAQAGTQH